MTVSAQVLFSIGINSAAKRKSATETNSAAMTNNAAKTNKTTL